MDEYFTPTEQRDAMLSWMREDLARKYIVPIVQAWEEGMITTPEMLDKVRLAYMELRG